MFGGSFIQNLVIDIDYALKRLNLIDPDDFSPAKDMQALPIQLESGVPFVEAEIELPDGRTTAKLMLDTGAHMAVTLTTPFVKQHGLLAELQPQIETKVFGLGGETPINVSRLPRVTLGSLQIRDCVIALATAENGSTASADYDGFLGGEILNRCRVVLDYPQDRVLLKPGARFDQPYEYDKSGLVLVCPTDALNSFEVAHVVHQSPAEESEFEVGDIIQTVDGKPASQYGLAGLRELFTHAKPGTQFRLQIHRAGRLLDKSITARKMV